MNLTVEMNRVYTQKVQHRIQELNQLTRTLRYYIISNYKATYINTIVKKIKAQQEVILDVAINTTFLSIQYRVAQEIVQSSADRFLTIRGQESILELPGRTSIVKAEPYERDFMGGDYIAYRHPPEQYDRFNIYVAALQGWLDAPGSPNINYYMLTEEDR